MNIGDVSLDPGTPYRFGIMLGRAATGPGTGNIASHTCGVFVEIVNRNPASTPLGAPATSVPQRGR